MRKYYSKGIVMRKVLLFGMASILAACSGVPNNINDDKVFFAFDSAEISDDTRDSLESQALYMKTHPSQTIIMEGHCDERGSTEYNLALGALRAGNAAQVLISEDIEPERIKTISYGKEKPQYFGTGEEVWAKNRNTTTKVVEE